jgi:hypothetical protein
LWPNCGQARGMRTERTDSSVEHHDRLAREQLAEPFTGPSAQTSFKFHSYGSGQDAFSLVASPVEIAVLCALQTTKPGQGRNPAQEPARARPTNHRDRPAV